MTRKVETADFDVQGSDFPPGWNEPNLSPTNVKLQHYERVL